MRKSILYLPFFLFISIICGCNNSSTDKNIPDKLVIGLPVADLTPVRLKCYKSIVHYLEKEIGVKKIVYFESNDYTSVIEAMRTKKVDIAQLGELSYIMAAERAKAKAIVMLAKKDGSFFTSSMIITSPKTNLKSMNDVKNNAKNLTLSFGDPASTSGHLYPRNYLNSIGLDPEKSFKSVVFTNSHSASIFTVISGKVDVACIWTPMFDYQVYLKKLKREDIVVLWKSEPYISVPISVRGDLPANLIEKIQKAYLDLPKKEPALFKEYVNASYVMYPEQVRGQFIFVPCADSMYNGIRKLAKQNADINFSKMVH